jgi:hypothetical protein
LGSDGEIEARFETELGFDPVEAFESSAESIEATLTVMSNPIRTDVVENPTEAVLLMLQLTDEAPSPQWFRDQEYGGVLHVVPDDSAYLGERPRTPDQSYVVHEYPALVITESAAGRLLNRAGLDLDELQQRAEGGERIILPTGLRVRLAAPVSYEPASAVNVIGYFPAADIRTQGDRILVIAEYTTLPPIDGQVLPGADNNASGVAVMMEIARLWREQGFEPKRTVIFLAADIGGAYYLSNHPVLPTGSSDTTTAVILHGLAAGEPFLSFADTNGGLGRSLQASSGRFDVDTKQMDHWWFFFQGSSRSSRGRPDPTHSGIAITRLGDALSGTPEDTLDHLDPALLAEAGQAIGHYLMVLSSR